MVLCCWYVGVFLWVNAQQFIFCVFKRTPKKRIN